MQKCLKYSNILFGKYSHSVNRKTQMTAWSDVVKELTDEGTKVDDLQKLKQNVSNWVRRACVSVSP